VFDCLPELLCSEPFDHAHRSLTARAEPPDGCGRGRCWNRQRFDRQQRAAKRKQMRQQSDADKDELYKQIGQLKVELDFLKKRAGLID
jgi:hypothetical protein